MKRILPTILIALLAGPAANAQGDADPAPPDQAAGQRDRPARGDRGDAPQGDQPARPERLDRPERGGPDERGERGPRGDRGPGGFGERGDREWRLAPDELDEALELIERINPRLAASLRETQQESPERAIRRLAEEAPRTYELLRMRAEEPARFELHVQSMQVMRDTWPLVRELRQAQREEDQEKIDELTEQVRASMETLYDIRLKLRELEIQELRDQIEALEAQHEQDRERRADHIAQRLEEILRGHRGRHPDGQRGGRGEPDPERTRERRGPGD